VTGEPTAIPNLPGQTFTDEDLAVIRQSATTAVGDIDTHTTRLFALAVARATPFIERMHQAAVVPVDPLLHRVVVVRGAFWKEHDWTGARGERILKIAADLGLPADTVDTPSLGTLATNTRRITEHLAALPADGRRVILVSLSKGSADVKAAYAASDSGRKLARVAAWIDLSGTTEGTHVTGQLQRTWWRWLAIRLIFALRRQPVRAVTELAADNPVLSGPPRLPPGTRHIRVLGFPLQRYLYHPWSQRAHQRLAHMGPNDGGGVLLQHAIEVTPPPSVLLPVWAADHYMHPPWDFDHTLTCLLRTLCAEDVRVPSPSLR
jgi:hypothetical protein